MDERQLAESLKRLLNSVSKKSTEQIYILGLDGFTFVNSHSVFFETADKVGLVIDICGNQEFELVIRKCG